MALDSGSGLVSVSRVALFSIAGETQVRKEERRSFALQYLWKSHAVGSPAEYTWRCTALRSESAKVPQSCMHAPGPANACVRSAGFRSTAGAWLSALSRDVSAETRWNRYMGGRDAGTACTFSRQ